MTARNYCPAGDCDHLTKEAKEREHGTPEKFSQRVWSTQAEGLLTAEEALETIRKYQAEYDAAP